MNYKNYFVCLCLALLLLFAGCTTETTEVSPADTSLASIKDKGKLIAGSDIPYGVMEFVGEDGNIQGIDFEIATAIADDIGVDLDFIDYDWEELFVAIKSGEIDIAISAMTITPERSEEMLFSIPYFNAGQVIVIRKTEENIKVPEDLKDKIVATQPETTGYMEAIKYSNNVETYESYEIPKDNPESGMLYDLKTGAIDAIIVDYIAGIGIIKIEPSFKIIGNPFTEEFYGIATKLGNKKLMGSIDSTLRELKRTGELKAIEDNYVQG